MRLEIIVGPAKVDQRIFFRAEHAVLCVPDTGRVLTAKNRETAVCVHTPPVILDPGQTLVLFYNVAV